MAGLEEEILNLRDAVRSIKTTQPLGGSSYQVYYSEKKVSVLIKGWNEATMSGSFNPTYAWVLGYVGESDFPLVNYGFEVRENGILKPYPRIRWLLHQEKIKLESILGYSIGPLREAEATVSESEYDVKAPNVDRQGLRIGIPANEWFNDRPDVNVEIKIKLKANCPGVLKVYGSDI